MLNVLLIKNRLIPKEDVLQDFSEEEYFHNFTFADEAVISSKNDFGDYDEIWTYGDVRADKTYKLAIANSLDTWEMK